jgi:hypothetical protein
MNPFDILSSLSTIQNVIDHVQNAADGDLWGLAGLGADGVGVTQGVISLERLAAEAAETPVIEAGLWAIIAFNWMCGFGEPEKGDRFGEGGSQFNEIIEKRESAAPGASWTGSGSDAYASQNVKQQDRAQTMVVADFDMNQIISCEAGRCYSSAPQRVWRSAPRDWEPRTHGSPWLGTSRSPGRRWRFRYSRTRCRATASTSRCGG